jgi:hypothetical protein
MVAKLSEKLLQTPLNLLKSSFDLLKSFFDPLTSPDFTPQFIHAVLQFTHVVLQFYHIISSFNSFMSSFKSLRKSLICCTSVFDERWIGHHYVGHRDGRSSAKGSIRLEMCAAEGGEKRSSIYIDKSMCVI